MVFRFIHFVVMAVVALPMANVIATVGVASPATVTPGRPF